MLHNFVCIKGAAFTSHAGLPPMWPGLGVKCGLSLLLVLYSAPRGFSPDTPVFPSPQKPTFPNSNWIWNSRATLRFVSRIVLLSVTKSIYLFIYLFKCSSQGNYCNELKLSLSSTDYATRIFSHFD